MRMQAVSEKDLIFNSDTTSLHDLVQLGHTDDEETRQKIPQKSQKNSAEMSSGMACESGESVEYVIPPIPRHNPVQSSIDPVFQHANAPTPWKGRNGNCASFQGVRVVR